MPKFYGQNKKTINPRHFLEETSDRDDQLAPGAVKSDVMLAQAMQDFERNGGGFSSTFHPSVMYRILRTGNIKGQPGKESEGVPAAKGYIVDALGRDHASELPAHIWQKLTKDLELIKQTIDLEPGHDSGPNFQPSKDTPFREQMPS